MVIWSGVGQSRTWNRLAEAEPRIFESVSFTADDQQRVEASLVQLAQAAKDQERTTVSFTVEDLNLLISTKEVLAGMRDTCRVRQIQRAGLVADWSQAVRGDRYLNGTFTFRPMPSDSNSWQLDLVDLAIPGKEVPPALIATAKELQLYRFSLTERELQAVLRSVEEMRLEDGRLVIQTKGRY
ncbi:MAG: hypothetical protein AAF191_04775 [Verrucomicrobiota bacterium]